MRVKNILIILFFISFIFAGNIIKEFSFGRVDSKKIDNYDLINLEECNARLEEVGKPIIPFKDISILIPPSAEISSIEILELERKEISGNYYLYPAQMPRPIGVDYEKEYPFIIDQEFYEKEEEYPKELYRIIPSGCKSGFRIGGIFIFPLHYIPKERKLILYSKIKIRINYEEGKYDIIRLTKSQRDLFSQDLKYLVINPEDINKFSPPIRFSDNPDIDYVILTDTNLVSSFVPLRDWLRKTGLWTEIRTTQWVDNNYSGRDLQEKIRNFIKNYFQTQGLKYVLLGGDGDYNNPVVPTRQAGPLTVGGETRPIACDLYYADLDGSWDNDNDNLFGEWTGDTVDLYHDVYIGRVPVENASHINNFITKLFKYLKTPDTTYQKKLLLPGALLWSGYNHMQSQDSIADSISPSDWIKRKLDQGTNTGRRYEVRDSINQKFHFVHLVAHGNYQGSWITSGTPQYHRSDCGQQTNTNALCIINAISCMPGAFDSAVSPSCLAESALNAPNAAIGVMMNTRYGWGSPPYIGYSELLDVRFYHYFFTMDSVRFAPCHQSSKEFYRNYALNLAQVWRWCYYELTLFGEPSMLMWKDYPKRMVAYFPHTIPTGNQVFPCTVKTLTGTPVEQALVCLWKGNEVYQTGYTNSSGIVTFDINPTSDGYMYVTATKPNYYPYEDSSEVVLISYDVAVTEIISPTGIVDSGATITPQAKIKNLGIYPASFQAIFRIGTFYNQQVNVNLNPNDSTTVSFTPWQANQRGSHIVKCTLAYANDERPENNSLIDSVFVRVLDVAVLEIISPTGTVDSGTNVTPQAKVKNFGNVNSSFVARFRIGTFYNQQVNVNLNPNDSTTVSFTPWQANQRGSHTVKCTVALTFDRNPNNNYQQTNVYVRVLDMGVTQIVSPQGNIDSGAVITPQARVKNYGNENSNFKVKFRIGNFYLDSLTIGLAPDRETLLNFTSWQANQLGTHTVKCTTLLIGDLNPYNNYQTGQVTVGYKDVGIIQINTPTGVIDSPGTITPQIVVKNFGSLPVSFPIYFKITGPSSYFNSQTVLNLMPNEERQVNFAFWQVGLRGNYLATCSLNLSGDRNPDNDKLDTTFTVQVKDVGVLSILSPKGIVDSGEAIIPQVRVKNYGSVDLLFKTILKIPPIYGDSQEINLNAGKETTLTFNNFVGDTVGLFVVNCSLRISDVNVVNNVKRETLFIAGVSERDVGVLRIIAPLYYGVSGEIRPLAVVKNFSPTPQSFKAFFKIIDSTNNNLLYFESTFVFNLAPNYSKDVAFPIWQAQIGLYSLTCSTYIPKDINGLNDVVKGYVKIEASLPDHWNLLRDLPLSSKKIKGGAALTFLKPNFIYAFKGNKTTEFYRYDITTGNWEKKTDIPYAAEKRKPVGNGGALTSDLERYVYAIKGNNTLEFWRYDAINDQWERLPDIPLGSKRVKDGAGLAYVKKRDSSFVYLLKGSKTNEFCAYYIEGNIWLNKEFAPLGPSNKPFNKGSAITFDNKENIYAIKGGEFEFYAYNINTGIWQRKADLPMFYNNRLKKNKQGCALTANSDGIVFAFRGNNTLDFLAYYPEEGQWYYKEPIPVYPSDRKVKDGGALTYSPYNNMIYAFKGNNTNEFWCYLFYEALAKREEMKKKESKQNEINNLISKKGFSKYEIYDAQGRKVKEMGRKGIYLLKIYDNNSNLRVIKIIKIK